MNEWALSAFEHEKELNALLKLRFMLNCARMVCHGTYEKICYQGLVETKTATWQTSPKMKKTLMWWMIRREGVGRTARTSTTTRRTRGEEGPMQRTRERQTKMTMTMMRLKDIFITRDALGCCVQEENGPCVLLCLSGFLYP